MKRPAHLYYYRAMLRRLLISVMLGMMAALIVWLFHQAMLGLEWLLFARTDGSLVAAASSITGWRRALTPALGGLAAGALLWGYQRYQNQKTSSAPTDYMEAIEIGDGRLDVSASLVKSLASLLVVSSGSAIGREGAMVLLAALFASVFAQRYAKPSEWKLWVACGAAAGMASAYHAPLAGSLFIAEILFGTLMLASLGPVVIAAVSALLTTNLLHGGQETLYQVQALPSPWPIQYFLMALLGVLAGISGPLFLKGMAASGHAFRSLNLSPPLQLALGGIIVGLLSLIFPEVWGNGYSVVQSLLTTPPGVLLIAGILICKLLAVLASSGSGAPGGVFTPTLFVGAALGMLCGQMFAWWPVLGDNIALLMALTGMATLLAATTHAPIMAALMVCEMTGEYTLLPGLLLSCVISTTIARWLRPTSVYHSR
ncbi:MULTISPECIES: voltage-gated ClC-type chloride channel ClcB [Yersinia]|jgi:CIC family chloride channel protein|uniref:Voltage-gated ClC-type chloride channel ClcB n=1 Tax=Yersinia intermedia TaxID=631 RepID=A0A0T9M3D7_YERIN|nr:MULTISPECIES: voltage-gated ClC-type chloride channel ClcB [Yersinia]AVI44462.1 voltage-gated ClC-type chloride channel ClcB [Yersinia sp. FDAARGOS_228]AVL34914.1 voltage-gated ClC-type chloride channel ClcB [Yersinia intermedia]EEQ19925.1 Voltage-gated ClC-type chloride channel clcB [Yersinia intermedia ATCC 29909]MCB5296599.1 voltage-gated ClC-type chloride channel ClcB [Yersinia intermedia]MCB5320615.1 voltage-gated ClC-type chloride channel ClcB [Yersinia intermedia]